MISIVIPVYNTAATLDRCVESIAGQKGADFEMILVDDGSPDNCPDMCDAWARRDARIRVVHKRNGGLSSARNAGIDTARGELLMFADSDDYLAPDTLKALQKAAEEHPQCDIVEFPVERELADGTTQRLELDNREYHDMDDYWLTCQAYAHSYACNKLYRRQLFDNVRYPEGKTFEDICTLPRLLERARAVATTSSGAYHYTWNSNGITARATGEEWRTLLNTNVRMANATRRRADEEPRLRRAWADYYMHVLNIQLSVCMSTADRPTLATHRQAPWNVARRYRLKAALLCIMGVPALCRLFAIAHRCLSPILYTTKHAP